MGAWYVFASIGLYPMVPGVAGFTLNMPQFEQISIYLPKGILKISGGKDSYYINKMYVNGNKHNSTWIDWKLISNGGKVRINAQKTPNKKWGVR